MTVTEKMGHISDTNLQNRQVDWLNMEWYETSKRILHKKTMSGIVIVCRFLQEDPAFTEGDIVYHDESTVIAIKILPCDAIVLLPRDMHEVAAISYETGNKHLPLFYWSNELLVPFDQPYFRLMSGLGYIVKRENRQLLQPLKTTVKPHGSGNDSIFSKVMKIAARYE